MEASRRMDGHKRVAIVTMTMLAGLFGIAISDVPARAASDPAPSGSDPGLAAAPAGEADPLTQQAVLLTERLNPRGIAPVWVDRRANQVVVGTTSRTPDNARSVVAETASNAGPSMRVETVKYTLGELEGIRDAISQGRGDLQAAGFKLGRVGLRPPADKVAVEVLGTGEVTSQASATISKAFGIPTDAIVVEMGDPRASGKRIGYSRTNDSTPWSSSINLRRTAEDCTAGPGVIREGNEYLLTAAHCYDLNQWVYNGRSVVLPTTSNDTKIGEVSNVSTADNGVDAELIDPDSSQGTALTMYLDWNSYVSMSSVVAVATIAGGNVCVNGADTGARCSAAINTNYVDYSDEFEGRTITHLVDVYRGEGQAAGQGDSGGPVYVAMTPRRYIGIIQGNTGRGSAPVTCDVFPTTTGGGSRLCSQDVTFTSLEGILDYYSAVGPNLYLAP